MQGSRLWPAGARLVGLLAATTFVRCGEKLDAPAGGDLGADACNGITYETAVNPILEAYCTPCHDSRLSGAARQGAPATVNLDTYEGAEARAEQVLGRIEQGTMPPEGDRPTPEETEMIRCWVEGGMVRE